MRELLGDGVPKNYIEQVIAEADIDQHQRVTYENFLDMWRQEIEDRKLNALRGISKQRTVSVLAEEMLASSSTDEEPSDDDECPYSGRLVSIAEIEQEKSRSSL